MDDNLKTPLKREYEDEVVYPSSPVSWLEGTDVQSIQTLRKLAIETIGDVANLNEEDMRAVSGRGLVEAEQLRERARLAVRLSSGARAGELASGGKHTVDSSLDVLKGVSPEILQKLQGISISTVGDLASLDDRIADLLQLEEGIPNVADMQRTALQCLSESALDVSLESVDGMGIEITPASPISALDGLRESDGESLRKANIYEVGTLAGLTEEHIRVLSEPGIPTIKKLRGDARLLLALQKPPAYTEILKSGVAVKSVSPDSECSVLLGVGDEQLEVLARLEVTTVGQLADLSDRTVEVLKYAGEGVPHVDQMRSNAYEALGSHLRRKLDFSEMGDDDPALGKGPFREGLMESRAPPPPAPRFDADDEEDDRERAAASNEASPSPVRGGRRNVPSPDATPVKGKNPTRRKGRHNDPEVSAPAPAPAPAAAEADPEEQLREEPVNPQIILRIYFIVLVITAILFGLQMWEVEEVKGFFLVGIPFVFTTVYMLWRHGVRRLGTWRGLPY